MLSWDVLWMFTPVKSEASLLFCLNVACACVVSLPTTVLTGDEKKHQAIDENGEVAKVKIDGNASEGNATLKTEKPEASEHVLQGSHPKDSALATCSTTYSRPQVLGVVASVRKRVFVLVFQACLELSVKGQMIRTDHRMFVTT